jgi:SAM-dependent methyltransferase
LLSLFNMLLSGNKLNTLPEVLRPRPAVFSEKRRIMSDITDQAAQLNRTVWNSFRRQRDEGRVQKHHDVVAEILAGNLSPQQRILAGEVAGKRLLDLGCGDGFELLEWAHAGAQAVGVDNSPRQIAAARGVPRLVVS